MILSRFCGAISWMFHKDLKPGSSDTSANLEIDNLISQPKHMLWVLKRTISIRASKTHVKSDG